MKEIQDYDYWSKKSLSYVNRSQYVRENAWFILTKEIRDALYLYIKDMRVLEVGAGYGYLANQMRLLGHRLYRAVDNFSTGHCASNGKEYLNFGVERINALEIDYTEYDAIVMCWPTYDDSFAHRVISKMKVGQILIYQGESLGGCCADDAFFDTIAENFTEITDLVIDNSQHVQFYGLHDQWSIYRLSKEILSE